jgi:hypothetical protein
MSLWGWRMSCGKGVPDKALFGAEGAFLFFITIIKHRSKLSLFDSTGGVTAAAKVNLPPRGINRHYSQSRLQGE